MHQAQIHTESVLFVCPALSFVKSPLHFHHAALQGGHFVFWFRIPPGPGFVGNSRKRARRSPARGFQRFDPPLGAAPKPTASLGVSHGEARKPTAPLGLLHGEARKPTTPPGLLHGEARKPTAPPGVRHGEAGKPTAPPGLRHGEVRKPTTAVAFARPERRASL